MIDEWDDISFTVKPSFLKGMRLFRNKVSGETRLVDEHGPVRRVELAPAIEQAIKEDAKVRKPRRKAKSEGDK